MQGSDITIFLSYSWVDGDIANQIDQYYESRNIEFTRDVRDIGYWESISDFMKKIRITDYCILLISDSYLKSKNCMFEIMEVMKDENYSSRIKTLILENASIFTPLGKSGYIKFWDKQYRELEKSISEISSSEAKIELLNDLRIIKDITNNIGNFIGLISDKKSPVNISEFLAALDKELDITEKYNHYFEQRYGLTWFDKENTVSAAKSPVYTSFAEDKNRSRNWDTTGNLYIEGDPVQAMKLLRNQYMGSVKTVFIDPPFNTFYNRQYHSNWLNMMYPYLFQVRCLLQDNGVMLIHIDDHEVHNLRLICDEIFGEQSFVGSIVVMFKKASSFNSMVMRSHSYILVYARTQYGFKIRESINSVMDKGDNLQYRKELSELFKETSFLPPCLPVAFIKSLLQITTEGQGVVLDFFSGIASTAHAVMELNAIDGGDRKFIMIEALNPYIKNSEAYKNGFTNTSALGQERIRRAGDLIMTRYNCNNLDIGFRVLKV